LRLLSFADIALSPRQGGHLAGVDHDRSQAHASDSLAQAMLSLPSPTQRRDEHHGIVIDWARRGWSNAIGKPLEPRLRE
jgi:hypothetical protein